MHDLLFVVYSQGLGGERLAVRLSQLPHCRPLEAVITPEGRTRIVNDLFGKFFINCPIWQQRRKLWGPAELPQLMPKFQALLAAESRSVVVPCHWPVSVVRSHFPSAGYVVIVPPRTAEAQAEVREQIWHKVWQCVYHNPMEILGEIASSLEVIPSTRSVSEIYRDLPRPTVTGGEIYCVSQGMVPTLANQRLLFEQVHLNHRWPTLQDPTLDHGQLTLNYTEALTATGDAVWHRLCSD